MLILRLDCASKMFWSRVCTGVSDTASGSDIEIVAADSVDPTPYYPHPRLKMTSALFNLYQVVPWLCLLIRYWDTIDCREKLPDVPCPQLQHPRHGEDLTDRGFLGLQTCGFCICVPCIICICGGGRDVVDISCRTSSGSCICELVWEIDENFGNR